MDTFFTIFLVLHIIGGSVGLLTGSINLVMRKGDRKHKMVGRVFVYSMLTAGLSALILSVVHPNYFLFMVGVFTIYMVGTGNRYIYLRMLGINHLYYVTVRRVVCGSWCMVLDKGKLLWNSIYSIWGNWTFVCKTRYCQL